MTMQWSWNFVKCSPQSFVHALHPPLSHSPGSKALRSLIAGRPFRRGERIAWVPSSSVLGAERSHQLLSWCYRDNPHFGDFLKRLAAVDPAPLQPCALWSRDALLMTAAIFVLHHGKSCSPDVPSQLDSFTGGDNFSRMQRWVRCWPSVVPPLALLLRQSKDHQIGSSTLTENLAAPENHEIEGGTRCATSEVAFRHALQFGVHTSPSHLGKGLSAVSPSMKRNFFNHTASPLNQRQLQHLQQSYTSTAKASMNYFFALDKRLEEMLHELVVAFVDLCGIKVVCESLFAALLERMRWAHFMLRSRGVNVRPLEGDTGEFSIVPLLDMLNHHHKNYNVTYMWDPRDGEGISINACADIAQGDELTLHYGCEWQRKVVSVLNSKARSWNALKRGKGIDGEEKPRRTARHDSLPEREIRPEEMSKAELDGVTPPSRFDKLLHFEAAVRVLEEWNSRTPDSSGSPRKEDTLLQNLTEAEWMWRFGFDKSEEEKVFEASHRWSSGVLQRVAELTDARRHGKRGEFVIGVPEGLHHLRAQRAQLERNRYANGSVFPPQNA